MELLDNNSLYSGIKSVTSPAIESGFGRSVWSIIGCRIGHFKIVVPVGKIEQGQTIRLKQKAKNGLAYALGIPTGYLDAVCKGMTVEAIETLKFCPQCWTSGSLPDPMWTSVRAKYCYACGSGLLDRYPSCGEQILSPQFKFCSYCGKTYKQAFHRG